MFFFCLFSHCYVQSAELEDFVLSELTNLRNEMSLLKQNYQRLKEDNEYLKRKNAELDRDLAVIKETVVEPIRRNDEETFRKNESFEAAKVPVNNTASSQKISRSRTYACYLLVSVCACGKNNYIILVFLRK